jgi:predicted methyltransferase
MVVEDVHVWGCQGFVQALGDRDAMGGMAYYRAIWSEMVGTGGSIAAYIPADDADGDGASTPQGPH